MIEIYFFLIVSFLWLIFATINDIRKREVPDWLSHSLIGIGLGVRLIYSIIFNEYKFILFGLIGLGVCFLFGNLMYYTKQWGGGDAKLLMGLGTIFADYKMLLLGFSIPFLLVLIINIFFMGSIYGIGYSIYLAIKNKDRFVNKWKERKQHGLLLAGFVSVVMIIVSLAVFESKIKFIGIILGILFILLYVLIIFIKTVEDSCLYNFVKTNKLTEGDWIAKDVFVRGKKICSKKGLGLTLEDITKLKKFKVKEVLIKDGMPFVPGFLLGLILTLLINGL